QIVANPERRVGEYSLVTPTAANLLLDPTAPLASRWPGSIVERVARHAAAAPGRTAIRSRHGTWTYADLDRTSDGVAADLARAATAVPRGPGTPRGAGAATCARRRAELAAALLGPWKAGAAFVVLDPAYPLARLTAIVDAAAPAAWIDVAGDTPEALRPLAARF